MKKLLAIVITLILASAVYADFYVDVNKGCDQNIGSIKKPFKTIEKAKATVRDVAGKGLKSDVTVFIRGGTYYLDKPLSFDNSDSGNNGFKVIYKGYKKEDATIICGKEIKNWSLYKDNIYKADVGKDCLFSNMMENGQLSILARTPNEGYFAAANGTKSGTDANKPVVVFKDGEIGKFGFENAQVLFWGGQHLQWDGGKNWNWFMSIIPVSDVNFSSKSIYLESNALYTMFSRNRYYLRGAMEFLDKSGEFFLDRKDGVIYYIPRKLPIEKQKIVAASAVHLIEVRGKSINEPAGNIAFENLKLQLSDTISYSLKDFKKDPNSWYRESGCDGLVFLKNTKNITVKNCNIKNSGMSAIAMLGANEGHQIYGNLIEDSLHNGIAVWGYYLPDKEIPDLASSYFNKNHKISNNYIRNCGRLVGHASGIEIVQAGDIEVSNNLIEKIPRYAISVYSCVFAELSRLSSGEKKIIYGKEVTWENHYDYLFTRNISVFNNECRYVMQDSSDGASINFYGVGTGNRIENNLVHDSKSAVTDGILAGIYVDDHANGFIVRNNIVCRLRDVKYISPMFVKGIGNVVTNNILADNDSSWGNVHILETPTDDFDYLPKGAKTEKTGDLVFERNIFYRNKGSEIYSIFPISESIVQKSDYNIFYQAQGKYEVKIEWVNKPLEYWKSLYGKNYEANSIFEDPMFVDPDKMNYKLKPNSPALKLGFKDIDVSNVGLKKDFQFKVK